MGEPSRSAPNQNGEAKYGLSTDVDYWLRYQGLPTISSSKIVWNFRDQFDAPLLALVQRSPFEHIDIRGNDRPVKSRHRRKMVGATNRWQTTHSVTGDLLGQAQAYAALTLPRNISLLRLVYAQKLSEQPRKISPIRASNDRMASSNYTIPSFSSPIDDDVKSDQVVRPGSKTSALSFAEDMASSAAQMRSQSSAMASNEQLRRLSFGRQSLVYWNPKQTMIDAQPKTPKPDVILYCLNNNWELHSAFLVKSARLSELLEAAKQANDAENLPDQKKTDEKKHSADTAIYRIELNLAELNAQEVSEQALAIALANLYYDHIIVDRDSLVPVMVAAHALGFSLLLDGCAQLMIQTLDATNVCRFHSTSLKCGQQKTVEACDRWLELNLVPKLSRDVSLRELSIESLQRILNSSRLFVYDEFSVFKVVVMWIFLTRNPQVHTLPTMATVIGYFNALPKASALLDRDDGQCYTALMMAVRLHGITDASALHDLKLSNIVPQPWLLKVLDSHYTALQSGGDMLPTVEAQFQRDAVRQGFILEHEPFFHTEVFSLHGFHFELKSQMDRDGTYSFFITTFIIRFPGERSTFSMRVDRVVQYQILMQTLHGKEHHVYSSGIRKHKFGLQPTNNRSYVLRVKEVHPPAYVLFSFLFPAS